MLFGETLQLCFIIVAAICLAVGLNTLVLRRTDKRPTAATKKQPTTLPVFLFDSGALVDATPTAHDLIARRSADIFDMDGLLHILHPFFPTLANDITDLGGKRTKTVFAMNDETLSVIVAKQGTTLRISLSGIDHFHALVRYQEMEDQAFQAEAETHKRLCQNAPQLIWQEDDDGQVVWANKSYLNYSDLTLPPSEASGHIWPSDRLFNDVPITIDKSATPLTTRRSLQLHGENAEHWFDVTSMPGPTGALHYASDANDIMRAQESQKAFMSTIANTFAQLSIGLAIFDRKGRLASYNPAFGDLTDLPTAFLIGRPTIEVVLDRLREMRKLPEPVDYSSFREKFAALKAAASNGTYVENWEMPDGQTFRVTGKPHPDGALAFLFEDITAEISLTRRFRTEIETGQAVLDNIPDALAVFSASNVLVMSNHAYAELWGDTGLTAAISYDLRAALRRWKTGCVASSIWRNIENFANTHTEREQWSESIILTDGRQAKCHILPLIGGRTMVKFVMVGKFAPTLQKLTMEDPALLTRKVR